MASPGELIKTVAEVFGTDPATVANIYRGLREAGQVTKGGRGRSAATVTPRDAAMLLIAVCATDSVKDAPTAAASYADLRAGIARVNPWADVNEPRTRKSTLMPPPRWTLDGCFLDDLTALPVRHAALDAIATFIALFSKSDDEPAKLTLSHWEIDFAFQWPNPTLKIEFYARTKANKHYSESMQYFIEGPTEGYIDVRLHTDASRKQLAESIKAKGYGTRLIAGDLKIVRSFGIVTLARIGELIRT